MLWLLIPLGFLLGSIPFGLLLGKLKGVNIRDHGSGNIGATNVFRTLGKKSGITCLLLDFFKGLIPVLIAEHYVPAGTMGQSIEVGTALAAILGHNYSPWIGFKGGKGIATSAGALAGLIPPVAFILLILIFVVFTFSTKYVSVGSIATAVALPILMLWGSYHHGKISDGTWNLPLFIFSLIAGFLAVWKHRANITRLRAGTENRIGQTKQEASS
ncbi:MAG: glycerol-3-phosphate acyltransferase PlsY [Akkermansiaceae bacterium]|jgi:glycerol-3-phosphate acyltransferase PlsY|tara:strand:- start:1022 stop:1666 length:645 start_codon:yes stop_codon:yes gene_type:complete